MAGDDRKNPNESRIGPIRLDWKINVTALVAFFLSAFALFLQVVGYWKGSIITLHPVDKVLISTEGSIIRIGARMVYTNDGASGYNALVLRESVSYRFGGHEYRQWAEERGRFAIQGDMPALTSATDAAPFMVPAMKLVTHEAYFAARERSTPDDRWSDRITRNQFVQLLEAEHKPGTIDFTFRTESREISGFNAGKKEVLTTTCSITLDDGLIRRLKNEGWSSRSCHRTDI